MGYDSNPYLSGAPATRAMPASLRAARVLLYVVGAGTLVAAVGAFLISGRSAEAAGAAFTFALPGVLSVVAAWRVSSGGRGTWWFIVVLQACYLLYQLGRVGTGAIGGLIGLIFPIAIFVLVMREPARVHFR